MIFRDATLEKVTAFVLRGPTSGRELLVFRHPSGGIQLPAGTIEEGESIEAAALREASEETGLNCLVIVRYLGASSQAMRPNEQFILRRTPLLLRPEPDSPVTPAFPSFLGLRRGLPVRLVNAIEKKHTDFCQVIYEEFDGPAHEATVPSRSVTGWVPKDAISEKVVRHFFQLEPTEPTPKSWFQIAEEWSFPFELYWISLPHYDDVSIEGLVPSQVNWLSTFIQQLRDQ